jgi:16S rRNA (adenine(1408)-N(1))-methyltransferase
MLPGVLVMEGRTARPCGHAELAGRLAEAAEVVVDLGCGDARFLWREARARPAARFIGVDPVARTLAAVAARAARRPERGGAPNLLLVVAAVEALPAELAGIADRITVNLPWGSLLAGLVRPEAAVVAAVAGLGKAGARVALLFNQSVFDDPDLRARLGLPAVDLDHVDRVLAPAYARAGLLVRERRVLLASPRRTTWGQRLVRGAGRRLLAVEAVVAGGATMPD